MIEFQEIVCHIVFDIKMVFMWKHTTNTLMAMTYASVVSRDSVQIGFMLAALNGLDVMACNLENAFLNPMCGEDLV